ncbi:MAG: FAD-binding oxidoreductase [Thermomicrobiales bacterium]
MATVQERTTTAALTDEQVEALASRVRGATIRPGDEQYDAARAVWNGMVDQRPAVIARCLDTADVVAAVKYARDVGLPIAVRGGGHNAAGLAVADGAVVVDLTMMRRVEVDPAQRTARAQGGATWGDFDQATQAHGLATAGGVISTTGIAGLTLGGGLGYLMRSYGLASDNLLSAEVVTADGQTLTASADEHQELFWGLRGGGGNFGVVTSFEYRLYPVGPVLGGMIVYPADRAIEVLKLYREVTKSAPDELTVFAGLMTSPEGMPIIGLVICYHGPLDEGERVLRPLREFGPPLADQVGPMPYIALQTMLDEAFPSGLPVYWRSHFLTDINDEAIAIVVDRFSRVPSPLTAVLFEQFGGAVARVGGDDTAFAHRDAKYNLAIISRWPDPAMADENIAWTRELWTEMQPFARGVYVNYLGIGEQEDRVRAAYGDAKYARLAALKKQYDPTNQFRFNQNIKPS